MFLVVIFTPSFLATLTPIFSVTPIVPVEAPTVTAEEVIIPAVFAYFVLFTFVLYREATPWG